MVLNKDIFSYLSSEVNQQTEVSIAFRNYLEAFHLPNESWQPKIITDFFWECLIYPHWQQNKKTLIRTLHEMLIRAQKEKNINLDLEYINWNLDYQIIELQSLQDIQEVLLNYLQKRIYKDQSQVKIRMIPDESLVCALVLDLQTQQLETKLYDRRFILVKGELVPLRENYKLAFDSHLNLIEGRTFFLELGPFVRCRFQMVGGLCDFYATRGFMFQKFQTIAREPLELIPRLFYKIKRIENYFLKKDANPFYVMLINSLERILQQIRLKESLNSKEVMDLLIQAKNALEYVFNHDKLLQLLIKELEEKTDLMKIEWNLKNYSFFEFEEDKGNAATWKSDLTGT